MQILCCCACFFWSHLDISKQKTADNLCCQGSVKVESIGQLCLRHISTCTYNVFKNDKAFIAGLIVFTSDWLWLWTMRTMRRIFRRTVFWDEDCEEEGDNKKIPSQDTSLLLPHITYCTYLCGVFYGRYVILVSKVTFFSFCAFFIHRLITVRQRLIVWPTVSKIRVYHVVNDFYDTECKKKSGLILRLHLILQSW